MQRVFSDGTSPPGTFSSGQWHGGRDREIADARGFWEAGIESPGPWYLRARAGCLGPPSLSSQPGSKPAACVRPHNTSNTLTVTAQIIRAFAQSRTSGPRTSLRRQRSTLGPPGEGTREVFARTTRGKGVCAQKLGLLSQRRDSHVVQPCPSLRGKSYNLLIFRKKFEGFHPGSLCGPLKRTVIADLASENTPSCQARVSSTPHVMLEQSHGGWVPESNLRFRSDRNWSGRSLQSYGVQLPSSTIIYGGDDVYGELVVHPMIILSKMSRRPR
ncbi:hypothetical protein C8Q78DRAFT_739427 [Trametes maxima]|nr:hypothetical protein C8Q78DRAFT_739427 [Trametes maxima]